MKKQIILSLLSILLLSSCSDSFSNGERIGFITKWSKSGIVWKSWEGQLNTTQTGMNTSNLFEFSDDNDNPLDEQKIRTVDSAANLGWKVKINYRQTQGWNWFSNRGHTDYFIKDVVVLDRDATNDILGKTNKESVERTTGRVIDTIFVVIDKSK